MDEKVLHPFDETPDEITTVDFDGPDDPNPYKNPKFYNRMRRRLKDRNLPASVLAVMVGFHTICDMDTGEFYRNDTFLCQTLGLPKSTVSWAFLRAEECGLIEKTAKGNYTIKGYEEDRKEKETDPENYKGYFRIPQWFFQMLPEMVRHRNGELVLFVLEILDCSRNVNKDIVRRMDTLVYKKKIGSTKKRVKEALELIKGFVTWTTYPNATGLHQLVQFWVSTSEERSEDQNRLRSLHGQVSAATKKGFEQEQSHRNTSKFLKNVPAIDHAKDFTWRALARTTRKIIQHGLENGLTDSEIVTLGRNWGIFISEHNVRWKSAYLSKLLRNGDLVKSIDRHRARIAS